MHKMSELPDEINLKEIDKLASDLSRSSILFSKPDSAEPFFNDSQKKVRSTYKLYNNLIKGVTDLRYLTQEVELVDNFYIIEGAISDIESGVIKKEFLKLPQISRNSHKFVPRAYHIFSELLKGNQNKIDRHVMETFINSYQKHAPLTLRELYAAPTILKIILVENIQHLMQRILLSFMEFKEAEFWLKQIIDKTKQKTAPQFSGIIYNLTAKYNIIPLSFGFYLLQRLSHYGSSVRPVTKWLKSNLLKQGVNIKDLAEIESEQKDTRRILIANIFESLRWLNQVQWNDFVDNVNVVDKIFRDDPAGIYVNLDDRTKNLYKDAVVKFADVTGIHEVEIAKYALRLARTNYRLSGKKSESKKNVEDTDFRKTHVGCYLIGDGKNELEKKLGYKSPFFERMHRLLLGRPNLFYFGSIASVCSAVTIAAAFYISQYAGGLYFAVAMVLISVLNSEIAVNLVNSLVVSFLPVKPLPKFDFKSGVPDEFRTFAVVPGMFRDAGSADELLRRFEVNYLSNKDKNIYFALLMDFTDSLQENTPKDKDAVSYVANRINELNDKYPDGNKRFFLFHRKRLWNGKEKVFMGWERKRGKLREFNQVLRGKRDTTYIISDDEFSGLPDNIKYIITLDEDTRMPKDSASQLIGCIAHPLNRAIVDSKTNIVSSGYGMIQPRITVSLKTAGKSLFSRIFSSASGIDSYSTVIADVYQDLFKSGIFFGKGIYDIDVIEKTMSDRIPDNTVLSHDLLEGIYARAGLATDIQLFDEFPSQYHEYMSRLHRWIRGDWQIIDWLFPKVRISDGSLVKNNFSFISKWKIFDNLRRSLIPAGSLILLLLSWFSYDQNTYLENIYVIAILSSPFIFSVCINLLKWERGLTFKNKIKLFVSDFILAIAQILIRITFLFYNAVMAIDAIVITFIHKYVTHKHLLQWQSSGEVAKRLKGTVFEIYSAMWFTQIIPAAIIWSFVGLSNEKGALFIYTAYGWNTIWIISPLIAYWLGRSRLTRIVYRKKEKELLRRIACKTSRYFLEFTNEENNWLIPDHFQEEETLVTSHNSTSPTNIGIGLVSLLSAYDFGYLGIDELKTKLSNTFASLEKLERYNGHFYNWYDVKLLKALIPKYVSSVDSANFFAAILTLKQGISDILKHPVVSRRIIDGLNDVLVAVIDECDIAIKSIKQKKKNAGDDVRQINKIISGANKALASLGKNGDELTLSELQEILLALSNSSYELKKLIAEVVAVQEKEDVQNIYFWIQNFEDLVERYKKETRDLFLFSKFSSGFPVVYKLERDPNFYGVYDKLLRLLNQCPSLLNLKESKLSSAVQNLNVEKYIKDSSFAESDKDNLRVWFGEALETIRISEQNAAALFDSYEKLIKQCDKIFQDADFKFLYNKERGLFHIGYNATFNKIDSSYYDFLASESNIISFIAVLKNHAPKKHWFHLNRKFVQSGSRAVLYSWGGSLFEYLTSLIFLDADKESLLGKTATAAIKTHISYADKYNIPWGMGESAYNLLDANQNYQYQTFGVPGIGLKRGLGDYLVVAPYTTVLSLLFEPRKSMKNLRRIIIEGGFGHYGFYDAIDYTGENGNKKSGVSTKVHYAHHQGFVMASLNNALHDGRVRKLFNEDPLVASASVLLEEKVQIITPVKPVKTVTRLFVDYANTDGLEHPVKQYIPFKTPVPRFAFLSNGNYCVSVSNTGCGYSKFNNLFLTRFKEDPTLEGYGTFFYIRDLLENSLWSPAFHPAKVLGKNYKVVFSENKAEFSGINKDIESVLKITVPSEDNVEIRELTLINRSEFPRTLEISSYGEVVLASYDQFVGHPAFQKLFIKSEFVKEYDSLVFTRNNLPDKAKKVYFAHFLADDKLKNEDLKYATSRESFIGRNGGIASPSVFNSSKDIAPDKDYTLDAIFSLRKKIDLKPNESSKVVFINAYATTYDSLIGIIRKYRNIKNSTNAIDKVNQGSAYAIRKFGISSEQALAFQELASRIMAGGYLRDKDISMDSSSPMVRSLWKYGISGDAPIVVVKIKDIEDINFIKNVLLCYRYLKHKGLNIDLAIYNEHPGGYIKTLHDEIDFIIRYSKLVDNNSANGKVFHLKASLMPAEDRSALLFTAMAIFDSGKGSLEYQIKAKSKKTNVKLLPKIFKSIKESSEKETIIKPVNSLSFYNGLGGFDETEKEYVITLDRGVKTPVPWVNIISNPDFGFMVSESGSGSTWSVDSYDNRLTAWNPDNLLDQSGEIFYIRDEKTGELWSPMPYPLGNNHSYIVRHGKGYSVFEHNHGSIEHKLLMFVPKAGRVKLFRLTIKNAGLEPRNLSVTGFFELVLGVHREYTKHSLVTSVDEQTKAVITENIVRNHFQGNLVFLDMNNGNYNISTNREEFFGRHGSVESPAALKREKLSGEIKYESDHGVGLQTFISLKAGEEKDILISLGEGEDIDEVRRLVKTYREPAKVSESLGQVKQYWNDISGNVSISTPDKSLDIIFNDWLLYQALSSRIFTKAGYYQPSGAFGFRDQLQDITAFILSNPALVREIIIKVAHHQFREGDAQNWWHEHNNFGMRSVLSDQQLWLPAAVHAYVSATNDLSILNEQMPFLEGPLLDFKDKKDWVGVPEVTKDNFSLYEHCIRAIEKSLRFGEHGLPLIGKSDWNDGFNEVGIEGKGESVWSGFFLYSILTKFSGMCVKMNDTEHIDKYRDAAESVKKAIELHGWDGAWYKRAYFDNGVPLGSHLNTELKIDSIAQSWSVLSGAGKEERSREAMDAVEKYLMYDKKLLRLLNPPLQKSPLRVGYTQDYPPGVRENGSQYNHAALWSAQAFAVLGEGDKAKNIIDLINPINRSKDLENASKYRVEPYVVASDIYSEPSYEDRGGWTWYTGSAGLMYRTVLEFILGIKVIESKLIIDPCIPKDWKEFKVSYRFNSASYEITVKNPLGVSHGVKSISVDGKMTDAKGILLSDDGKAYTMEVVLGE
jgi:cellobiose phosphorylase